MPTYLYEVQSETVRPLNIPYYNDLPMRAIHTSSFYLGRDSPVRPIHPSVKEGKCNDENVRTLYGTSGYRKYGKVIIPIRSGSQLVESQTRRLMTRRLRVRVLVNICTMYIINCK